MKTRLVMPVLLALLAVSSSAPVFAPGEAVEISTRPTLVADSILAPDAPTLALWSDAARVPTVLTEAVAYVETGRDLNPVRRGAAGEWGRFQIMPRTAATFCPAQDVTTYNGNLACFIRIIRANYARCQDWRCALERYNGRGPAARAYAERVLGVVRHRVLWEVDR